MIQPISGPPPGQPPGQGDNLPSGAGNQPLSSQQRTSLEKLNDESDLTDATTKSRTVGGYQARYWSVGRFTRCFRVTSLPLSIIWRNVCWPRKRSHSARQLLAQLGECYVWGNNRQAVTDYIRHNFGQTPLNQLSPEQLKTILTLLQEGKMVIPQPQQREATDRPLLPAEHNALKTAGDQTCGGNGGTQQTDLAIDAGTFRGERWRVNSSETV